MIPRRTIALAIAVLLALFAFSWWREHRPAPTVEQAVAHERSAAATTQAAKADTVFLRDTAPIAAARQRFREATTAKPGAPLPIHDTVWMKGALATADTVIALDSVAIADAGRAIEAHHAVESSLRAELTLALQPRALPWFGTTITALYDPVAA